MNEPAPLPQAEYNEMIARQQARGVGVRGGQPQPQERSPPPMRPPARTEPAFHSPIAVNNAPPMPRGFGGGQGVKAMHTEGGDASAARLALSFARRASTCPAALA